MAKRDAKTLTPRLRFPEFRKTSAWGVVALDRVAARVTAKNGDGRVTRVLTNSAEFGVLDQRDYFDKDIATAGKVDGYYIVEKGDYVYNPRISTIAPVGPISRNNLGEGVMSPLYTVFRFLAGPVDFYQHFFRSNAWHPYLRSAASTGARHDRMSITNDAFMRMPVPTPEPDEQQRIADCLTSLDEVIVEQGRKVEALKAHKRGFMQQLFPREGETVPRLRFPEFRDAPEWDSRLLGAAATFYNGRAYAKDELLERGKYWVLRVGNFFTNDHWYFSDLELDDAKYCDEGDLLYAWSASFGPRIWRGGKTIYHYHIWKVVENEGVSRAFLFYRLDADTERMKAQAANGIGMFHITKGTIENWMSAFPLLEEQQRIADCLSSLDAQITAESNQLAALKTHKQGLMQQLFPASVEA